MSCQSTKNVIERAYRMNVGKAYSKKDNRQNVRDDEKDRKVIYTTEGQS